MSKSNGIRRKHKRPTARIRRVREIFGKLPAHAQSPDSFRALLGEAGIRPEVVADVVAEAEALFAPLIKHLESEVERLKREIERFEERERNRRAA